jgi:hypothetical protein
MLKRTIIALLVMLILAACGQDEDEENRDSNNGDNRVPAGTIVLTLLPIPDQTIVPGCPVQELEDWFESTYFSMQGFALDADELVKTANEEDRETLALSLIQLLDLRDVVAQAPTPTCVQESSRQVLSSMEGVVDALQRFANGEIDKDELAEKAAPYLQSLTSLVEALPQSTDPLYRLTPSSSSDSDSATEEAE